MELRPETLEIIARLQTDTGYPVQVTALGSLNTLAAVNLARGATATHYVLFNPLADAAPDYLIAHQCAVGLRLFSVAPELRFEVAPSDAGRATVERELTDAKGLVHRLRLTPEQTTPLRDKLYGGLMMQLRTTPVGLRVDRWLWERYPGLRDVQQDAARELIAEGTASLEPEVRSMTPPRPLMASLAMSAATAEFWARTWAEPEIVDPFRSPGSYRDGRALMRLWDMIPDDALEDRSLVDAWADMLGIRDWYEWRPYPTPGESAPAA
jgi:hypothetical protein